MEAEFRNGVIQVILPLDTLRFAAENHPAFWDGESGDSTPNIKITDQSEFSLEVVREINREAEDGSTMLTRMFDEAIAQAIENGCEGVNHED